VEGGVLPTSDWMLNLQILSQSERWSLRNCSLPFSCTRSQDQNVGSREALLEPGEVGLLPVEEAADGVDQDMIGRHGAQTTGLFQRQDALHPPVALVTGRP
jgi:hypothetical protein